MAEFLIKAIDAVCLDDPVKDKRGCYKRGDAVLAMPDGHVWGKEEGLPKFVIVKIPGLDPKSAEAKKYLEKEYEIVDLEAVPSRRRSHKFLLDEAPLAIKNDLINQGETTITFAQAKEIIENKFTGLTEDR